MGRRCAVSLCRTGQDAEVKKRDELGERRLSMFSIPKRHNALKVWSSRLRQNLSANNVICELHFAKEDIIIHPETSITLADGSVYSNPRRNNTLKAGAAPVATATAQNDVADVIDEPITIDDEPLATATIGQFENNDVREVNDEPLATSSIGQFENNDVRDVEDDPIAMEETFATAWQRSDNSKIMTFGMAKTN